MQTDGNAAGSTQTEANKECAVKFQQNYFRNTTRRKRNNQKIITERKSTPGKF